MIQVVSAEERKAAYVETFSSPAGQIVMADLIRCFGFTTRSTFGRTPYETYANEGSRAVLLHIDNRLYADLTEQGEAEIDAGAPHPTQETVDDDVSTGD